LVFIDANISIVANQKTFFAERPKQCKKKAPLCGAFFYFLLEDFFFAAFLPPFLADFFLAAFFAFLAMVFVF